MKSASPLHLLWAALVALASLPLAASDSLPLTSVFSNVSPTYVRTRLPDGSLKPETFAFGKGQFHAGQSKDRSIDPLPFNTVARLLAPSLARSGYVNSLVPEETNLLIVVHWGTTIPFDDGVYSANLSNAADAMRAPPQVPSAPGSGDAASVNAVNDAREQEIHLLLAQQGQLDQMRERANRHNAATLGYGPALQDTAHFAGLFGPLRQYRADLIDDVEDERYYVILAAYDFQRAWKTKEFRLLWVTRFSIQSQGNRFDRDLAGMARVASAYFGKETRSLVRTSFEGRVEVGEPIVIGVEPSK